MGFISINGKTYTGSNVNISGDRIIIDGNLVEEGVTGVVRVDVTGELANLKSSASVTCESVTGSVDAGGSVTVAGDVGGDVDAGGSVVVKGSVRGNVDAGGSVVVR